LAEGTDSTNEEDTDQAHWVVNALV
jgi:hypothetical protein